MRFILKLPIIPRSEGFPLAEHLALIGRYSPQLVAEEIPGTQAIMGEVPDYAEVAFLHLDASREKGKPVYLFGADEGFIYHTYARTQTPAGDGDVAGVGFFDPVRGLGVHRWPAQDRVPTVYAAPLIVPATYEVPPAESI